MWLAVQDADFIEVQLLVISVLMFSCWLIISSDNDFTEANIFYLQKVFHKRVVLMKVKCTFFRILSKIFFFFKLIEDDKATLPKYSATRVSCTYS